ncbi:AMP-binding protein, partial [bacterium]|nr:AMP-binding protein [bacterium]
MEHPTVPAQFDAVAAAQPGHTAIYHGRDRTSYADLQRHVADCAAALQSLADIQPGDRVAILLRNCPEYIHLLLAILKSGATAVPVNSFLKPPEVQHIASDCQVTCLISSTDFAETTARLSGIRCLDLDDLRRVAPAVDPRWPPVAADDLAVIIYTSGTTGKPKGAMLSHANIAANVASCIDALGGTDRDRVALLLPMFHSFMLTVCICTPLCLGAGIVLIRSVSPFKAALREMIRNRATIFIGIPQIFQALAQSPIPFYVHWLLRFRLAISGAAPLPRETLDAFSRKMRFPLLEGYGLSEAAPVVCINPVRGVRKPGSVGLPLAGVAVKIFDDQDRELPLGQVGEIVVRGPNVMRGYYNQPEATAESLRNGWLHTGDLGRQDDDGYTYIVDRRKEMLLVRGLNVYPREIEEVL